MATRTLLKGYIKQGDNTYAEHEIHPYTDMESVVSLNNVGSGNYSSYSGLPLEGGPENVLTSFLKTRSYLKSLEAFTGKKITDSTTDTTDQENKIPSLKALQDVKSTTTNSISQLQSATTVAQGTANDALRSANAAKTTADNAIPRSDINGDYTTNKSATQVLSMQGANNLYEYAKGAKTTADNAIPQSKIRTDYKNISQNEANSTVLSMMGARELYLSDKDIYKNLLASYVYSLTSIEELRAVTVDRGGITIKPIYPTCLTIFHGSESKMEETLGFSSFDNLFGLYKVTVFYKDDKGDIEDRILNYNTNVITKGSLNSVIAQPIVGEATNEYPIIQYKESKSPIKPYEEAVLAISRPGRNSNFDWNVISKIKRHNGDNLLDFEKSGDSGGGYAYKLFLSNVESASNFFFILEYVNPNNAFLQSIISKTI